MCQGPSGIIRSRPGRREDVRRLLDLAEAAADHIRMDLDGLSRTSATRIGPTSTAKPSPKHGRPASPRTRPASCSHVRAALY